METRTSRKRKERVYSPSAQGRAAPLKRTVATKERKLAKLLERPTPERNSEAIEKLKTAIEEKKILLATEVAKQGVPARTPDKEQPQVASRRVTRSNRVSVLSCCHYGQERYQIFGPSADFCEPCRQWDILPPDEKMKSDRNAVRNRCTSKHYHYVVPSKKPFKLQPMNVKKAGRPTKQAQVNTDKDDLSDSSVEDLSDSSFEEVRSSSSVSSDSSVESEMHKEQVAVVDNSDNNTGNKDTVPSVGPFTLIEYQLLKRKHEKVQREFREFKKQKRGPAKVIEELLTSMETLPIQQKTRAAAKAAKTILCPDKSPILSVEVKKLVNSENKKYMKESLFPPHDILKQMDLEGGGLCLNGIEILRRVENKEQVPYHHGYLPSSSKIKRRTRIVDAFAHAKAPFEQFTLAEEYGGGEAIEFKIPQVIPLVVRGFQLDEIVKTRPVMIAQSIDGARLTNKVGHLTYGLKVA